MKHFFFTFSTIMIFSSFSSIDETFALKISRHQPNTSVSLDSTCRILRKRPADTELKMACSGTLISDPFHSRAGSAWVLSAAHCGTDPKDAETKFYVQCGTEDAQIVSVSRFIPHPLFKFGGKSNDIALFKLHDVVPGKASEVLNRNALENHINAAQKFHSFQVETVDSGVSGDFGRPRFSKRYSFVNESQPLVNCSVVGYGLDASDEYGYLQSQALDLSYFMDLSLIHLFISTSETQHGVMTRPGDSGGPILCEGPQGSSFVIGVHSHSMEPTGLSYATATHLHSHWIQTVQESWYQVASHTP